MLKARRREPTEQRKFPEPRLGLPEDPTPFLGSGHFAAAAILQQLLTARGLIAVVGPVGAGKSTVCHRAANSRWARQWFLQDEAAQPVHRRFWVDLEDCRPGAETREKIAAAVGRPTFDEALARLGNGRPGLLILDNSDEAFPAEGVADDATLRQLAEVVSRGVSVVVTRRRLDGLDPGRPWTEVIEVPGFAHQDEARQLFDHLAPRPAADLRVDDVVTACDRLPLAVALVARVAAVADLEAAPLRAGLAPVGLGFARDVVAATLGPDDRRMWAALSQFPSGLGREDLGAILASIVDTPLRTIRLHDVGVVRRGEAGVRVPVALRLEAPTEPELLDLWSGYVRRAKAVIEPSLSPPGPGRGGPGRRDGDAHGAPGRGERPVGDRWLKRQVATLRCLVDRDPLPAGTLELALAGLRVHESGLEPDTLDHLFVRLVARHPDRAAPATAEVAATLEEERRFGTAELLATILVDTHRGHADPAAEAAALCQLGRTERLHGRYDDAIIHLKAARTLSDELGDGVGAGSALYELGQVDLDQGRLDEAEGHLGESWSLFAAHDRPIGEANANLELVRIDLARGHLARAEERLSAAIDRFDQAGHKLGSANACLQLGQLELARGHLDGAEGRFRAALDGYEHAADKVGFANACLQLGQVDLGRGRLDSAERFFGGALAGYERVGDQVGRANAALQLGQIDLARNRLATAAVRLGEAQEAYRQLGDQIGVANASLQLGQLHLARGERDEARRLLDAAQSAYDEVGDRLGSANSRHIEGMLLFAEGQKAAAMATFSEAARLYRALGRTASAGWSLAAAAQACTGRAEREGYTRDAVRLLEDAGMAGAAARVTAELAWKPPAPAPPLPPPRRGPTEEPPPPPSPAPDVDAVAVVPLSSPWPRRPERPVEVPAAAPPVDRPPAAPLDVPAAAAAPVRAAHGDPPVGGGPEAEPAPPSPALWPVVSPDAAPDRLEPGAPAEGADPAKPRFRLGRKSKGRGEPEPPTLPGF